MNRNVNTQQTIEGTDSQPPVAIDQHGIHCLTAHIPPFHNLAGSAVIHAHLALIRGDGEEEMVQPYRSPSGKRDIAGIEQIPHSWSQSRWLISY